MGSVGSPTETMWDPCGPIQGPYGISGSLQGSCVIAVDPYKDPMGSPVLPTRSPWGPSKSLQGPYVILVGPFRDIMGSL